MIDEIINVKVGHRVVIEDEMTMDQLVEKAAGRKVEFDFTVREKRTVRCGKEINTLIDVRHAFGLKRLILVRQYGDLHDVFVFEQPEWFEETSRVELMNEHEWLFDATNSYEDLADYPFVDVIYDEFNNAYTRVQRNEQGQHEGGDQYTFLIEYKAHPTVNNDRVLVVEAGCIDAENGGWIEFYEGHLVEDFNVRVA
jgi:hypothetical protein